MNAAPQVTPPAPRPGGIRRPEQGRAADAPGPRLPRTALIAVRLMYAGPAVELAVLIAVLVTLAGLTSASIRRCGDFSTTRWHAVLFAHLTAVAAGAPILLGLWLWMAWANARGQHAAKIVFAVVYGIITLGFFAVCAAGAQAYCTGGLVADVVLMHVQLAAMVLIFFSKQDAPSVPRQLAGPPLGLRRVVGQGSRVSHLASRSRDADTGGLDRAYSRDAVSHRADGDRRRLSRH